MFNTFGELNKRIFPEILNLFNSIVSLYVKILVFKYFWTLSLDFSRSRHSIKKIHKIVFQKIKFIRFQLKRKFAVQ